MSSAMPSSSSLGCRTRAAAVCTEARLWTGCPRVNAVKKWAEAGRRIYHATRRLTEAHGGPGGSVATPYRKKTPLALWSKSLSVWCEWRLGRWKAPSVRRFAPRPRYLRLRVGNRHRRRLRSSDLSARVPDSVCPASQTQSCPSIPCATSLQTPRL
jgi:hypothetical protein